MDSEVRQKFEAWKSSLMKCSGYAGGCDGDLEGMEHEPNCPLFGKQFATHFDAWRAAYEAGEISMKEKAAQRIHHAFCRTIDRMQNICDCDELAESIRALPLSGTEESKKEKA